MSESANDFALAEQFRNGDPRAVETVYDHFSPLVFSLFLRMTRDRNVAEDLVQELFIRIWNRAQEFDATRGSLGVWILSIARNMGIDYVRSAHARFVHRMQPIDSAHELPRESNGPESIIDQGRAVQAAFGLLNENQKRVLQLAYFEGFSQSEIADRLHEPLGTVKSWTRSALQNLRSAIRDRQSSKEAH